MKYFKLPRKFAERWLEELRSGRFTQLEGSLIYSKEIYPDNDESIEFINCDRSRACCLGVAAVMLGVDENILAGNEMPGDINNSILIDVNYPEELYVETSKKNWYLWDILAAMNDGYGTKNYEEILKDYPGLKMKEPIENRYTGIKYSFEEIAQWVEENVEFY